MTALAERVLSAAPHPPLSEMAAVQRQELEQALAEARDFEDLPGKWQAAILAAESRRTESGGGCCGG